MLNLMYITNNVEVAKIAERAGVDTIFVDMEYIGKDQRQDNLDTVQNCHTIEDVKNIRAVINKSRLLVRINPIHENTEDEVDSLIQTGADVIMLPWFHTAEEAQHFIDVVDGHSKTLLLVENKTAIDNLDEILEVNGIDEMYIGLNDLSLSMNMKFMFQPMAEGIVEGACKKIRNKNIPFGIGGIARIGEGALSAEYIIREHYRLGSTSAILSRTFCNTENIDDFMKIEEIFKTGIAEIRQFERECENANAEYFIENKKVLDDKINSIVKGLN